MTTLSIESMNLTYFNGSVNWEGKLQQATTTANRCFIHKNSVIQYIKRIGRLFISRFEKSKIIRLDY